MICIVGVSYIIICLQQFIIQIIIYLGINEVTRLTSQQMIGIPNDASKYKAIVDQEEIRETRRDNHNTRPSDRVLL